MNISPKDIKTIEENKKAILSWRNSIFQFLYDMWGLLPQPVKPEYQDRWEEVQLSSWETWNKMRNEVKAEWFGDYNEETAEWNWYRFEKGKHVTWQQTLILMGIEKANQGDAKRHLAIRSGHGIGKSATCSWVILWFLTCYWQAQVPCTAPTSHQMHDVLWKELAIWINRMPAEVMGLYEWTSGYIRMTYDPEAWFARARTSSKENTEAIAGVHADHVLIVVDEASGVPEQVFNTAEGALTSGNVFVVLISNPTRTQGYFYDAFHKNTQDWQQFAFNSEQSPVVDKQYTERQARRHGSDSDEYRIRVRGEFPHESVMDDSGYVQLIPASKITVEPKLGDLTIFSGRKILGVDPSGEGKDRATWVLRDNFRAEVIGESMSSNPKECAERTLTFIERYRLEPEDVVIDAFGIGSDVGKEIALASGGKYNCYTVLVGNPPKYEEEYNAQFFTRKEKEVDENKMDLYLNIRALMYFRLRDWLYGGGMLVDSSVENSTFSNEIQVIRYKRSLQGNKIQLMAKKDMLKMRIPSPNKADALALTFLRDMDETKQSVFEARQIIAQNEEVEDKYALL